MIDRGRFGAGRKMIGNTSPKVKVRKYFMVRYRNKKLSTVYVYSVLRREWLRSLQDLIEASPASIPLADTEIEVASTESGGLESAGEGM